MLMNEHKGKKNCKILTGNRGKADKKTEKKDMLINLLWVLGVKRLAEKKRKGS